MDVLLPGIDTEQALKRMAGNENLLKKILCAFYKQNQNTVATMNDLLASQNFEALEQAVHSLKGVAGNVGAMELHEVAARLDTALRGTPPDAPAELMDEMFQKLTLVLHGLETAFDLANG